MNQKVGIGITINPWPKTLDHYIQQGANGVVSPLSRLALRYIHFEYPLYIQSDRSNMEV